MRFEGFVIEIDNFSVHFTIAYIFYFFKFLMSQVIVGIGLIIVSNIIFSLVSENK